MDEQPQTGIDRKISALLSERFRYESRRSALARLSRAVFGLVGVALADTVEPFLVDSAEAATDWRWCGLHGHTCKGSCGSTGSGFSRAWTACCPDPSCNLHFCCTYTDRCARTWEPRFAACQSPGTAPSGNKWCGDKRNFDDPSSGSAHWAYICTIVSCASSGGVKSPADCKCEALPPC